MYHTLRLLISFVYWSFPIIWLCQFSTLTKPVSSILARVNGRKEIDVVDVAECEELFLDSRRSADLLTGETGKGFIS